MPEMKRFWDAASVVARAPAEGGGWAVLLDGKPVRLPGGGSLAVPLLPLAEAAAEEWEAAGGGARGGAMTLDEVPLTRLIGTALERIAPDPDPSVDALAAYGTSDLLCYRASEPPLAAAQARDWDPLLAWAEARFGARLRVTVGLMPTPQDPAAVAALRAGVAAHRPFELAALGVAVPALGSLVLGLALSDGRVDAAEAHRLATLDEAHQETLWGADAEAAARRERIAGDVALAARLLRLARPG